MVVGRSELSSVMEEVRLCGFAGPIKATTTSLDAETESLVTSILNLSKFWADITTIESDSKVLVDSLKGKVKPPWYIGCRWNMISKALTNVGIKHVYQEENMVADSLSKLDFSLDCFTIFNSDSLPTHIRSLIVKYGTGYRYHKKIV